MNETGISETDFSLLRQRVTGIETSINTLTEKIDVWMLSRQQNPWKMLAIALGVLVPLGWLMNMYITTAISPVATTAIQAKSAGETNIIAVARNTEDLGIVKAQNADSKRDRDDQRAAHAEIVKATSELSKLLATEVAQRTAKSTEIETQFRAAENYANLTRVWENRIFALLWEKVYGQQFPAFQFYPTIAQPNGNN
jgi:hypothetical protein